MTQRGEVVERTGFWPKKLPLTIVQLRDTSHFATRNEGVARRLLNDSAAQASPLGLQLPHMSGLVGAALTKSGGLGLAALTYISCGMLAVCVDGMLGYVLLCKYSGSGRADALERQGRGSTSCLEPCAGMGTFVTKRNYIRYFQGNFRHVEAGTRLFVSRGCTKEMTRSPYMAPGRTKMVCGAC